MTIQLTQDVRISGAVQTSGTTLTLADSLERELVTANKATYTVPPSFAGKNSPELPAATWANRADASLSIGSRQFITDRKITAVSNGTSFVRVGYSIIDTLRVLSDKNIRSNLRTAGVMATPPTVTQNNASLPGGQTNGYLRSSFPTMFRESGGQYFTSNGSYKSAVIWTSGGNLGDGVGGQRNFARVRFIADANMVTIRCIGTTAAYRFIVDDGTGPKYVNLAGYTTTATSGTQYTSLDFTTAGGRAVREITVELMPGCGFVGVYVGATEKVYESPECPVRTVSLGDSYCYGSSATFLADGVDAVMADYLGWQSHTNSGSGGTGWVVAPSTYTFGQRIANGDLLLGGTPDVVTLQGSVNDRTATPGTIQPAVLSGLQSVRSQLPTVPIFVFGVFNAGIIGAGPSTAATMESEISAAVSQFADPLCVFIPITGATAGAWLSGTGWVGATTGSGNADVAMFDNTHLITAGCASMGKVKALAVHRVFHNDMRFQ